MNAPPSIVFMVSTMSARGGTMFVSGRRLLIALIVYRLLL